MKLLQSLAQNLPDLGVPCISSVHSIEHSAHYEHVTHQVVIEGYVPGPDQLHVPAGDLHHQGVVVLLHGHDGPQPVLVHGQVHHDAASHLRVQLGQKLRSLLWSNMAT